MSPLASMKTLFSVAVQSFSIFGLMFASSWTPTMIKSGLFGLDWRSARARSRL